MASNPVRRRSLVCLVAPLLLGMTLLSGTARAQQNPTSAGEAPRGAHAEGPATAARSGDGIPTSTTHHSLEVHGRRLAYTATAGTLPLVTEAGETEAEIFYIVYTLDGDHRPGTRPLTFAFNGGPGSASVWLHLGALGPRRVLLKPDGSLPPPPFRLVDNEYTWLTDTDLVFIDPVGTGFSRATHPDQARKFWGVEGDLDSISRFVRQYLTRNDRWTSPLFLAGESYGTTRAAGLAGNLVDHGVALNGVLLLSTVLNFQTILPSAGNDLPYVLYVPSYTASAWFHHRLTAELEGRELPALLAEVEQWTAGPYAQALGKGSSLTGAERDAVLEQLARYTGLDRRYLDDANLRIEQERFSRELLRGEHRSIGRFDSRILGDEPPGTAGVPTFDPSLAAVRPVFTSTFNDYVRRELKVTTGREYYILGEGIHVPWQWDIRYQGYLDVSGQLRSAFGKNPYMRLFVGSGYYDLATPYFGTRYQVNHLGLNPDQRGRVTERFYRAGHMMYTDLGELARLKSDASEFIQSALRHE